MIELGSLVRDLVSGFKGAAVGRTEWLHGCVRIVVEPVELTDGVPGEPIWLDEQRVEEVEANKFPVSPPRCGIDLQLGNRAKDTLTGFEGIIVAKTVWSNGNVTLQIEPTKLDEKGQPIKAHVFEYERVQKIDDSQPPLSRNNSATSGGPQDDPAVARRIARPAPR